MNPPGADLPELRRVLVILNPAADSGRLASRAAHVTQMLDARFEHVIVCPTEGRGHARRLAGHGRDFDAIIAVGGDGTVHETALGLADHDIRTPLAVIPLGSGNDFARMLGMSSDPEEAARQIAEGTPVVVDAGEVSWREDDTRSSRGFVNAAGIGLTALTAHLAPAYKGWPLRVGYTAAALLALGRWIPAGATIRESASRDVLYSGPMLFATIGNARDSGGGYSLAPEARLADGKLDACVVRALPRARAIALMPAARRGTHITHPAVVYRKVRRLEIQSDRGLPIHADGEVVTLEGRDIRVRVRAGALSVIVAEAGMKNL
jgi:YegS/Rv2252/BmrU family lipid kinase